MQKTLKNIPNMNIKLEVGEKHSSWSFVMAGSWNQGPRLPRQWVQIKTVQYKYK